MNEKYEWYLACKDLGIQLGFITYLKKKKKSKNRGSVSDKLAQHRDHWMFTP